MKRLHVTSLAALGVLALTAGPVAASAAQPTATTEATTVSWTENPASEVGTSDTVNVATRDGAVRVRDTQRELASAGERGFGSVTFEPRSLRKEVDRIEAEIAGHVPGEAVAKVEVRGRTDTGWGVWTNAANSPAMLPESTGKVQARLLMVAGGGSPRVTGIRLTGTNAPGSPQSQKHEQAAAPLTYEVFATREGLVGETTANGHVIQPRDHFVALPSTRSLSPEGTDDYSVKVCSPDTGMCEIAPVWDVGPWNIGDDYWNPASIRENWTDLPQGMPEAEAAYTNGYNNGLDGSGRQVLNPAGIDLADGTFWDGLGLTDNSWVEVTYLWTSAAPATVKVGGGGQPLTIRSAPSTDAADVGLVARHVTVPVQCQTHGDTVQGERAATNLWHKIGKDQYIPAAYTDGAATASAPTC